MKIIDKKKKKNMSLSFEVFPPKKETAFETVKETAEKIAESKPAFMSVTYGAGGGTSRFTLDIKSDIRITSAGSRQFLDSQLVKKLSS